MPNSSSAKKRLRQDAQRNVQNSALKSEVKTRMKRVRKAVEAKDKTLAEAELKVAHSKLDKTSKKKIWHKNKVARLKGQLAKLIQSL